MLVRQVATREREGIGSDKERKKTIELNAWDINLLKIIFIQFLFYAFVDDEEFLNEEKFEEFTSFFLEGAEPKLQILLRKMTPIFFSLNI